MSDNTYQPPKVWEWKKNGGGAFANINRPISGATHEKDLPVGSHPLQLYSLGTPNGQKVTIMLAELLALGVTGAEYDAWLIRIGEGDQFSSGFVEVNPNSKIPALRDHSTNPPTRVFESGNILLYLAEKFGHFLPKDPAGRTETLNWLFWLQGAAPFLGGGFGHFYNYAPVKIEYAIDRFTMEASSTCWINSWRAVATWRVKSTPSRISPSGRGSAAWRWAASITPPSSSMQRSTQTCSAGRKTWRIAMPLSAAVSLTAPAAS